jgi:PP-loop superfamily ATP-utilizing enzyme
VSTDERIDRAQRIIEEIGLFAATVDAEGHEREIAAIRVPVSDWERLVGEEGARLAERVKAAGFRYVAIDLRPADEPAPA